jgi:hypothetical protein
MITKTDFTVKDDESELNTTADTPSLVTNFSMKYENESDSGGIVETKVAQTDFNRFDIRDIWSVDFFMGANSTREIEYQIPEAHSFKPALTKTSSFDKPRKDKLVLYVNLPNGNDNTFVEKSAELPIPNYDDSSGNGGNGGSGGNGGDGSNGGDSPSDSAKQLCFQPTVQAPFGDDPSQPPDDPNEEPETKQFCANPTVQANIPEPEPPDLPPVDDPNVVIEDVQTTKVGNIVQVTATVKNTGTGGISPAIEITAQLEASDEVNRRAYRGVTLPPGDSSLVQASFEFSFTGTQEIDVCVEQLTQ